MSQDPAPAPPSLPTLWAEVVVVLLLGVLPAAVQSIAYQLYGAPKMPFWFQAFYLIVRSVGLIALVALLIRRSGEPAAHFGMQRPRLSDLAGGAGLCLLTYFLVNVAWTAISVRLGPERTAELAHQDLSALAVPRGQWDLLLLIAMSLLNGTAEEIVMRAYLIPRFQQLFGSTFLALGLTTLLFAGYHSYQGSAGMISTAVVGLVYGGAFCLFRRFWPVAVSHALLDVIGFIMLSQR